MPFSLADLPFLLILPFLLAGSAFFSGSETALFGLSAQQRQSLLRGESMLGQAVRHLLGDPKALLVTLMFGNMTVNVLYFVVSSTLLLRHQEAGAHALWLVTLTILPLLLIIVLGEILPKLVANIVPLGWIRLAALPLDGIHRLVTPLARGLSGWVVRPMVRLVAPSHRSSRLDARELGWLVEVSRNRGVIGADEQDWLKEIVRLGELKVRDVMRPRVDLTAFNLAHPPERLHRLFCETGRAKILVYEKDLDHIAGVIYARQFLLARRLQPQAPLKRLVRGVRFVPELQRVDQLLADFRRTGTHLAIAVDEYGGTAGLVTLKDVVEQVIGDLDSESAEPDAEQIDEGVWRVSGRLSVHDWAETFGAELLPGNVSTVGGLIMALLGRVPRAGDRVRVANLELQVEKFNRRRIESVLIRLCDGYEPVPVSEQGEGEREGGGA